MDNIVKILDLIKDYLHKNCNNLDYTITRNGNLVGTSKTPYIESNLLENETIGPNSEITYTINYEFKENNQNQNIDQGKLFSTNLELIVK